VGGDYWIDSGDASDPISDCRSGRIHRYRRWTTLKIVEDWRRSLLRFDNGSLATMNERVLSRQGLSFEYQDLGFARLVWLQLEPFGGEVANGTDERRPRPKFASTKSPQDDPSYTPLVRACVRASLDANDQPPILGAAEKA